MENKGKKMAPEVGLEPTTPRLTAACSTIELLWNAKLFELLSGAPGTGSLPTSYCDPNGRAIYKSVPAPSNGFSSGFCAGLADGTEKSAASGLDDTTNGGTTAKTGQVFPIIDLQPLLVSLRRVWRGAIIK